jgi:hypothetical protein
VLTPAVCSTLLVVRSANFEIVTEHPLGWCFEIVVLSFADRGYKASYGQGPQEQSNRQSDKDDAHVFSLRRNGNSIARNARIFNVAVFSVPHFASGQSKVFGERSQANHSNPAQQRTGSYRELHPLNSTARS